MKIAAPRNAVLPIRRGLSFMPQELSEDFSLSSNLFFGCRSSSFRRKARLTLFASASGGSPFWRRGRPTASEPVFVQQGLEAAHLGLVYGIHVGDVVLPPDVEDGADTALLKFTAV